MAARGVHASEPRSGHRTTIPSEDEVEEAVFRNGEPMVIELPNVLPLATVRNETPQHGEPTAEEAQPADSEELAGLRAGLPECVAWRTLGDLLAHLPDEAEPTSVARLSLAPNGGAMQEDVRGVCWAHAIGGADAESVEWVVVPREGKLAAVAEWRRRCAIAQEEAGEKSALAPWPSARELEMAGVTGVTSWTQLPTQLLLLPPHALMYRTAGPRGALLFQWSRACAISAAESPSETCQLLLPPPPRSVGTLDRGTVREGEATEHDRMHALPLDSGILESKPAPWRRVQTHPPVALAAFLSLVHHTREVSSHGAGADESEKRLRVLLAPCRALLETESYNKEKLSSAGVRIVKIKDKTPRACDACGGEIFNRCVRIDEPLAPADAEPPNGSSPPPHGRKATPLPSLHNPRREKQRAKGETGDFCLRKRQRASL